MYVYINTHKQNEDGITMWAVGFYHPGGSFYASSEHLSASEASREVHYLNGGN